MGSKPHILAFPYPGKGHINPMQHFCNRLTSNGLIVTMIHTTTSVKSMKPSEINSSINIEVIPDGREGNEIKDAESYFKALRLASIHGLSQLIDKHKSSNNNPPTIILYSSIMPWLLDVVHDHGLRGASFFAQSLSVSALYYHMLKGTLIQKDSNNAISLPAMPPLEANDLPVFSLHGKNEVVGKLLLDQFSNIDDVDYILFNTFVALENEVACWMARKWPVFTIGPTISSMYQDTRVKTEAENNEICIIKWLDTKEAGSVVYVSFGSTVSVAEEQMAEIARGLVESGCDFLWVVRKEEESKLPRNLKSESSTVEKGLIVNWCPQLDVLGHGALVCFVTHCGWNSTLEALSLGVPMIAVPQWVDQTTNSKFIADVWHVGLRARVNQKGIVSSHEIERCIGEIVKTETGKNLKRNAIKWKKLIKEAVEGGSSARNIQNFVISL